MEYLENIYQSKIVDTTGIFVNYPTLEEYLENGLVIKDEFIEDEIEDSIKPDNIEQELLN